MKLVGCAIPIDFAAWGSIETPTMAVGGLLKLVWLGFEVDSP